MVKECQEPACVNHYSLLLKEVCEQTAFLKRWPADLLRSVGQIVRHGMDAMATAFYRGALGNIQRAKAQVVRHQPRRCTM